MSDERLRELERRWKESGVVEDQAAFLLERVRTGELKQERLELAAYCGHKGAQLAAGTKVPPRESAEWLVGLGDRWGAEAAVRAACAFAVGVTATGDLLSEQQRIRAWLADDQVDLGAFLNEIPPMGAQVTQAEYLLHEARRGLATFLGRLSVDQPPRTRPPWGPTPVSDWGQWLNRLAEAVRPTWGSETNERAAAELRAWSVGS